MKFIWIYCNACSTRSRIEVLTEEEIQRDPERPRYRIQCPRCHSFNIEIRE